MTGAKMATRIISTTSAAQTTMILRPNMTRSTREERSLPNRPCFLVSMAFPP